MNDFHRDLFHLQKDHPAFTQNPKEIIPIIIGYNMLNYFINSYLFGVHSLAFKFHIIIFPVSSFFMIFIRTLLPIIFFFHSFHQIFHLFFSILHNLSISRYNLLHFNCTSAQMGLNIYNVNLLTYSKNYY
jgi:hypothetical protein